MLEPASLHQLVFHLHAQQEYEMHLQHLEHRMEANMKQLYFIMCLVLDEPFLLIDDRLFQDDSNKTLLSEKKFSKECVRACVQQTQQMALLEVP